jgi:hypothetical protein
VSPPPLFFVVAGIAYGFSLLIVSWWIDLALVLVGAGGGLGTCFVCLPPFFFGYSPCRMGLSDNTAQFLDIPSGTRDLTRHLEDLAWRYPVESVERTSLRFCEALSQWRGKPELEKVSPHLHSAFWLLLFPPNCPFSHDFPTPFHCFPLPFPFSLCPPRVL